MKNSITLAGVSLIVMTALGAPIFATGGVAYTQQQNRLTQHEINALAAALTRIDRFRNLNAQQLAQKRIVQDALKKISQNPTAKFEFRTMFGTPDFFDEKKGGINRLALIQAFLPGITSESGFKNEIGDALKYFQEYVQKADTSSVTLDDKEGMRKILLQTAREIAGAKAPKLQIQDGGNKPHVDALIEKIANNVSGSFQFSKSGFGTPSFFEDNNGDDVRKDLMNELFGTTNVDKDLLASIFKEFQDAAKMIAENPKPAPVNMVDREEGNPRTAAMEQQNLSGPSATIATHQTPRMNMADIAALKQRVGTARGNIRPAAQPQEEPQPPISLGAGEIEEAQRQTPSFSNVAKLKMNAGQMADRVRYTQPTTAAQPEFNDVFENAKEIGEGVETLEARLERIAGIYADQILGLKQQIAALEPAAKTSEEAQRQLRDLKAQARELETHISALQAELKKAEQNQGLPEADVEKLINEILDANEAAMQEKSEEIQQLQAALQELQHKADTTKNGSEEQARLRAENARLQAEMKVKENELKKAKSDYRAKIQDFLEKAKGLASEKDRLAEENAELTQYIENLAAEPEKLAATTQPASTRSRSEMYETPVKRTSPSERPLEQDDKSSVNEDELQNMLELQAEKLKNFMLESQSREKNELEDRLKRIERLLEGNTENADSRHRTHYTYDDASSVSAVSSTTFNPSLVDQQQDWELHSNATSISELSTELSHIKSKTRAQQAYLEEIRRTLNEVVPKLHEIESLKATVSNVDENEKSALREGVSFLLKQLNARKEVNVMNPAFGLSGTFPSMPSASYYGQPPVIFNYPPQQPLVVSWR